MSTSLDTLRIARNVGTPLVAWTTADQPATAQALATHAFGNGGAPVIQWDLLRGLIPLNPLGEAALTEWMARGGANPGAITSPIKFLTTLAHAPRGVLVCAHNANRYLTDVQVVQALCNLRDLLKADGRVLVLLGSGFTLPPELQSDVLQIREPLPDPAQLGAIVGETYRNAGLQEPAVEIQRRAVDALRGLPAFAAEQATAMSLTKSGVKLDSLWDRKRQLIEATPGLGVWRGGERFADLGGLENLKVYLTRILNGPKAPRAIVFMDEIEKAFAGSSGSHSDNTGVSQGILQATLIAMQDSHASGVILIGPGGTGKSAIAKALGTEGGIPTIPFDVGKIKEGRVGASEENASRAFSVIDAVSDGAALYIATCNGISTLPPELRRRFKLGTFFVDLPTEVEQQVILTHYLTKYRLSADQFLPAMTGWTGAEIEQACDIAFRLNCPLREAATYVVPIAIAAADQIDSLRREASGRFLSAGTPGLYQYSAIVARTVEPLGRKIHLDS